jgi:hypothetical protein
VERAHTALLEALNAAGAIDWSASAHKYQRKLRRRGMKPVREARWNGRVERGFGVGEVVAVVVVDGVAARLPERLSGLDDPLRSAAR